MTDIQVLHNTTFDKPRNYYVYVHKYATGAKAGRVFYVGKGCSDRITSKSGRSRYWRNVVKKYGFKAHKVIDGISEICALSIEASMIKFIGRDNLVNLTDGWDGTSGYRHTEETKQKMREKATGRRHPQHVIDVMISKLKGRRVSPETRAKLSDIRKGVPKSEGHIASLKRSFRKHKGVAVYCSNGMHFDCVEAAAEWVRSNYSESASQGGISQALDADRRTAYGFKWSRSDVFQHGECNSEPLHAAHYRLKPVLCSNGMTFESNQRAIDWLRSNGFPRANSGNISKACRGKSKTAYGYKWEFND